MPKPPGTASDGSARRHSRRAAIMLAAGAVAGGGAFVAHWFNIWAGNAGDALTPREAHAAAMRGDVLLVDIRRPDEWMRTGVGEGAIPIDMRRPDFVQVLLAHAGTTDRPVALICARGVRSRQLSSALLNAGFSRVIDVPEGMLGSGAGPGWLASDLPVDVPHATVRF